MGGALGGKPDDPSCYNSITDKLDYSKIRSDVAVQTDEGLETTRRDLRQLNLELSVEEPTP